MARNKHILIGQLGEDIAVGFLENRGFRTIERNFRKKCGEIDIISKKDNVLHFIEVKTSTFFAGFPEDGEESYKPEDRIGIHKLKRLRRVIEMYILENEIQENYTFDVVVVYLNQETKKAKVILMQNVCIE